MLWACTGFSLAMGSMQNQQIQKNAPTSISTSKEIDTTWRHTKLGWQDSRRWPVNTYVPRKTVELLHPFTWAAIVLISVVATTIWASDEWEIARLFGEESEE